MPNLKEILDSLLPYATNELLSRVLLHFVFIVDVTIKFNALTELTLSWISILVIETIFFVAIDWKLKRVFRDCK